MTNMTTVLTANFSSQNIPFYQCKEICRAECTEFVRYNALSQYLWMIYASMAIITLFYMCNKNENMLRRISTLTGQPDTEHIQNTLNWLLFFGILLMIVYVAVFIITTNNIKPMT